MSWGLDDIPDLSGKRALVTGVTSGIGETTVLELARHGAEVILGARNPAKLEATIGRIEAEVPDARLHPLSVDVSDLASVRRAANQVDQPLHLLVNNAGVMATPHQRTADGLELQMATNYFGPFALTGLLFPRLVDSGDGRVVAISSQGSRMARRAPLDDPRDQSRRYGRWQAYFASKLADLLFIFELDRRCREQRVPVKGLAAHPGYASTALMGTGRNTGNTRARLLELVDAADHADVIVVDGDVAGFVITFAAGSSYDGENFAWFAERHDDFCYLDRIVIHEHHQRRGLGSLVYDQLERDCGRRVFALEVNLDPPNEPSLAFHRARGYTEVGQRDSGGHLVSLMTKHLTPAG